jgi:hypothetical protein
MQQLKILHTPQSSLHPYQDQAVTGFQAHGERLFSVCRFMVTRPADLPTCRTCLSSKALCPRSEPAMQRVPGRAMDLGVILNQGGIERLLQHLELVSQLI